MSHPLDSIFPLWRIRNITLFYILYSVYNMWFVAGVWVFIWGRFMTKGQIGISDVITFSIGFLFEIPSGVIADLMGRRRAILLGNILLTVGNIFVALSNSFWGFTLWYLVWIIGYAFQSGATEALAYDTIKREGKEAEWPQVIATSKIIERTTSLLATAIGGFLFTIWFRLPYVTFALTGIIGITAAYLLKEIQVYKKPDFSSVRTYLVQIREGLSVLAKPHIFPISFVSLAVAGVAFIYNWGLLRPLTADRFGYSPLTYSFFLSTISIMVICSLALFGKIRKKVAVVPLIFVLGLLFSIIFISMGLPHGWVIGGALMILLTICSMNTEISFSEFINLHTHEKHRATTLSAVALFTRLPYVVLAVSIGFLAEKNLLPQFTYVVGGIVLLIWVITFLRYTVMKKEIA